MASGENIYLSSLGVSFLAVGVLYHLKLRFVVFAVARWLLACCQTKVRTNFQNMKQAQRFIE